MKLKKLTPITVIAVLVLFIGTAISVVSSNAFAGPLMFEQMVPMRDGVKLHTFVYLPDSAIFGNGPYPTIVGRTPYGIGATLPGGDLPGGILRGWKQITAHGYAFVVQDARGRFLSEGIDRIELDEPNDGFDTIEWAAKQPWCNGKIGMGGSSAPGFRSYAAASARPPHLKAIFAQASSANLYNDTYYQGGAFELEFPLYWRAFQSGGLSSDHIKKVGLTPAQGQALKTQAAAIANDLNTNILNYKGSNWWLHIPLLDYPVISRLQPTWNELVSHPTQDVFRDSQDWLKTIEIPAIHVTTVYDIWHNSMLENFMTLQKRMGNQKLYVGPGNHFNVYTPNFWPYDPFFLWFDYWLKGIDTGIMDLPPIFYYFNGTNTWRYHNQWPLPGVKDKTFYLHDDGDLSTKRSARGERSTSYVYDPKNPVQSIGGRGLWFALGGAADQRPIEPPYRTDVLVYKSKVFAKDVEIGGNVKVTLHASSTAEDTDFTAKLIDVNPDGSTIIILDGVIRAMLRKSFRDDGDHRRDKGDTDRHEHQPKPLIPGKVYEFTINLGDVNYLFKAGHRIQVDISSSDFPRRARNTNSGNLFYTFDGEEDIVVATNTIYHGAGHPSYLVLPVLHPQEPDEFEETEED